MDDNKGEGFSDKTVDPKLILVPPVIDLVAKRNAEVAAIAGRTNQAYRPDPNHIRSNCVGSMIQLSVGTGIADANKIVQGAQVLYDYITEGKISDAVLKGSSFHTKGT